MLRQDPNKTSTLDEIKRFIKFEQWSKIKEQLAGFFSKLFKKKKS